MAVDLVYVGSFLLTLTDRLPRHHETLMLPFKIMCAGVYACTALGTDISLQL